jgi:hypothetical protein
MNTPIITKEFAEQFCAELNKATGEQYYVEANPNGCPNHYINLKDSDFSICFYQWRGAKLGISLSNISKRFPQCFNDYVSGHDMGTGLYGKYEPEELGVSEKTTVAALIKRTLKVLPAWKKYYAVVLRKSEAEQKKEDEKRSLAKVLDEKYKINGHGSRNNKMGYIRDRRVEVELCGDYSNVKINNLVPEKLLALLEFINGEGF